MKGFFAGILFAAPLTALVMWFVSGYQATIDTKVERAYLTSQRDTAVFDQDFGMRWSEMGGGPAACSSVGAQRIADLNKQLTAVQQELDEERAADKQRAANLDQIIQKRGEGNESH